MADEEGRNGNKGGRKWKKDHLIFWLAVSVLLGQPWAVLGLQNCSKRKWFGHTPISSGQPAGVHGQCRDQEPEPGG